MGNYKKGLLVIVGLIVATSAALAFIGPRKPFMGQTGTGPVTTASTGDGVVSVQRDMVQDKVLVGSDGEVAVALTLSAAQLPAVQGQPKQAVDLVVVLDRSGSMQGEKIEAARKAVHQLIQRLTPNDRLALVAYSNDVQLVSPLTKMDEMGRQNLQVAVNRVYADGGTNLGGGLKQGIDLFVQSAEDGRQRKVILISDGLANQGITDPHRLGQMAATATDHHFAVSTVGVGLDFNELLMTIIADQGTGSYYFLEDPLVFAQVFEKEFQDARQVAADALELRIPLEKGIRLVDAGGYPIRIEDGSAVITPGSLISGQQRKLFLTFQVPTTEEQTIALGKFQVRYQRSGKSHSISNPAPLTLTCVKDEKEVIASVDKDTWSERVILDEYNQLKEEVADAVRKGDAVAAQSVIKAYEKRNITKNEAVGSAVVAEHLDNEVKELRQSVEDTFAGPASEVVKKQKLRSKALQYESYQGRRSK